MFRSRYALGTHLSQTNYYLSFSTATAITDPLALLGGSSPPPVCFTTHAATHTIISSTLSQCTEITSIIIICCYPNPSYPQTLGNAKTRTHYCSSYYRIQK